MKKDRRTYEPLKRLKEIYTASINEVSIKNYLKPVDKSTYKKMCSVSEDRSVSNEVNPY